MMKGVPDMRHWSQRSTLFYAMISLIVFLCIIGTVVNKEPSMLIYPDSASNSSNLTHFGKFLIEDDFIYFSEVVDEETIGLYKTDLTGEVLVKISDLSVSGLQMYGTHLYFRNNNTGEICKMNLDGTGYESIVMGIDYVIDSDTGDIYYSQYPSRSALFKLSSDGEISEIYQNFVTSFQIQDNFLYFVDQDDFLLYRLNLGTHSVEVVSESQLTSQYTLTETHAFFAFGSIFKINLETLEQEMFYDQTVTSLAINGDWIYFIGKDAEKPNEGNIKRIKSDGTLEQVIWRQDINAYSTFLHFAGDWIYITGVYQSDGLYRIRANGEDYSEVELPME